MSRPDFLSQLPSLEELLENPRVAAAVDRVNRSAAATQVRTAVTRLGSEIARRADELKGLNASELLDRLLRQLDRPTTTRTPQLINATGQLVHRGEWLPPLPAASVEAATAAATGFRLSDEGHVAGVAARLLHAEKAAIASSPTAALAITLEALAGGGACVVARAEMTELAPGVRLDDVARRSGVRLVEVGATDTATADDYGNAASVLRSEGTERLVILRKSGAAAEGLPGIEELSAVAKTNHAVLVADVGSSPPNDATPSYSYEGLTGEQPLASGADIALLNAAGRLGGPLAGIVAGKRGLIEAINGSSAAAADHVEPFVLELLAATLDLFDQPEQLRFTHPLYQLLDAPLDNLRVRAERIASLITGADGVASAVAGEYATPDRLAWGVRVEPIPGATAADLQARLASQDPRVDADADGAEVILNLATVFPSQDRALIGAFVPTETPDHEEG
ncbi:MAG: L-selenocysteinyl-tRNA(Sec) synthase [Planctomycetota bacterium]